MPTALHLQAGTPLALRLRHRLATIDPGRAVNYAVIGGAILAALLPLWFYFSVIAPGR